MKKFFAVLAMLLFATPLLAQDQNAVSAAAPADTTAAPADSAAPAKAMKTAKAPKAAGDEEGIKKAFAELSDSWGTGDAKGVASHFTDDATLINPMGMEGHGSNGVLKVIESDLSGMLKGTQQTFDDFSFVWVMPNLALVDCTGNVTGMKKPDGTDMGPMKMHVYSVVVNRGGKGWKARAVRPYAFLMPPSAMDAAAPAAADNSAMPAAGKAAPAKADDSKPDATK